MIALEKLTTEQRNPRTARIDEVDTLTLVTLLNEEDRRVPEAVARILPDVARAVDLIAERLGSGGRLFYIGAGTSGRLGILDAVECPPTFRTDPELIQGLIAGGTPAIFRAQEGAEDNAQLGEDDLRGKHLAPRDVVCGIAASGRTPYVLGGLAYARRLGAATIALSCTEHARIAEEADIALLPITGPEAITGSTRLKAGTAQKLVLNMLSTGAMIRLGKTCGNLMVDVNASNEKLRERALRIVTELSGASREEASSALEKAQGRAKLAVLLLLSGKTPDEAEVLLQKCHGRLRDALAAGKEAR